MFGLYRTMLAIWVMMFHLLSIPVIGGYAVFSFYMLSGFLMTLIMHETYSYRIQGIKKYAINRFLRLYPMYWAVAIITLMIIFIVSEDYASSFKNVLQYPREIEEFLFNFSMVFPSWFPVDVKPRLSPPTWALTVEIFFYICIALGASKTKKATLIWLSVSIIYFFLTYFYNLNGSHRYFPIAAASLPFALGAFAYHYRNESYSVMKSLKLSSAIVSLIIYIANALVFCLIGLKYPGGESKDLLLEIGIYFNLVTAFIVLIALFFDGKNVFKKKTDKFLGDFSYPIYLCHWQCGLLASYILFDEPTRGGSENGILAFILASIITFLLAYLLINIVDNNISKLRNTIKKENKKFTEQY